MKTFYISVGLFFLLLMWLLNKPITMQAREFNGFSKAELNYLQQTFEYAMDNVVAGEFIDWKTAAVNGRIALGAPYVSKAKSTCRAYTEVYVTSKHQGLTKGVGCKRQGNDGWCRLAFEDVQSCALENEEWKISKLARNAIMQGGQWIDGAIDEANNGAANIHAPSVSGHLPNMPDSPTMPDISAPDIDLSIFRPSLPWDAKK